nr:MAG TPA: hypothetical protein [Caudoviricetes sp.]
MKEVALRASNLKTVKESNIEAVKLVCSIEVYL